MFEGFGLRKRERLSLCGQMSKNMISFSYKKPIAHKKSMKLISDVCQEEIDKADIIPIVIIQQ